MSDISEAAIALMVEELRQFAKIYGWRVFHSTELDAVDPESTFAITLMAHDRDWSVKFTGRTITASIRGALDYIKMVIFSDEPTHQSPPLQE